MSSLSIDELKKRNRGDTEDTDDHSGFFEGIRNENYNVNNRIMYHKKDDPDLPEILRQPPPENVIYGDVITSWPIDKISDSSNSLFIDEVYEAIKITYGSDIPRKQELHPYPEQHARKKPGFDKLESHIRIAADCFSKYDK